MVIGRRCLQCGWTSCWDKIFREAVSVHLVLVVMINTPCSSSMISTFTPCLNYVTGSTGTGSGSSPTEDCCDSLRSLMTYSMDCICLIVTGNVPVSIPFVNASLAISLPRVCQNSVPLQCKAIGVPLPPPGPVLFGPTPARARAPALTGPVSFGPTPAPATLAPFPRSHGPKASKEAVAATAAAAPPPAENLDGAPVASPPDVSLGPMANPGIRPVVKPNSASSPYTVQSLSLVLMHVGIMAFNFVI